MTFYQAFYLALGASGKTVGDICKATGIYPSYFSRLKSGQIKDVTWERALAIIEALGMTPNMFYELQMSDENRGGGVLKESKSDTKAKKKGLNHEKEGSDRGGSSGSGHGGMRGNARVKLGSWFHEHFYI